MSCTRISHRKLCSINLNFVAITFLSLSRSFVFCNYIKWDKVTAARKIRKKKCYKNIYICVLREQQASLFISAVFSVTKWVFCESVCWKFGCCDCYSFSVHSRWQPFYSVSTIWVAAITMQKLIRMHHQYSCKWAPITAPHRRQRNMRRPWPLSKNITKEICEVVSYERKFCNWPRTMWRVVRRSWTYRQRPDLWPAMCIFSTRFQWIGIR